MDILIRNGRVIDPANGIDKELDIRISNGVIGEIGPGLPNQGEQELTAQGLWVTPGLIDLHVHFRDPGYTNKETIQSGSRSAAAGGFTTVCCMPNTNPVIDSVDGVTYIIRKALKEGAVHVLPIGSITKGQKGTAPADVEAMKKAGICAVSEDGRSVLNALAMKQGMVLAAQNNVPVFSHCEDLDLVNGGCINEGSRSAFFGLPGISNDSEEAIVARDIVLARSTKAKLHICHVSTSGSVQLIREAKKRGENVSGEVTPHHFTLCDDDILELDGNYKMNPPLRSSKDRDAVLAGLADGTLEVIATDHAPHEKEGKTGDFQNAMNGIVGLETAFALAYTELVEKKVLSPSGLIEKLTVNPAKILEMEIGTLTPGASADIAIWDVTTAYKVNTSSFFSKSKNSPFQDRPVKGKAVYTIVNGKIVYRKGAIQ